MRDRSRIGRDVMIILFGAAIGTLFTILVAYPELLANSRANSARIESNSAQIELLWEAHEIRHQPSTSDGGKEQ